jgi:DNA-binding CsgD family transcriptional regulator
VKRLSAQQLAKALDFLRDIYGVQDLDDFARRLPVGITRVIAADISTYSEVNPARQRIGWHYQPNGAPLLETRPIFEQFMDSDPIITWYASGADGQATRISDLMSRRQYHSLPIYNEFYRFLDVQYQIGFLLETTKPLLLGMTLNRSARDFTDGERLVLNVLRPHLIQAYWTAEAMTRSRRDLELLGRGLDGLNRAIILLTHERAIVHATAQARKWLTTYFGWPGRRSIQRLPSALDAWLHREMSRMSGTDLVARPSAPIVLENDGRTLSIAAIVQEGRVLLLLEERPSAGAHTSNLFRSLQAHGLTLREAEVLSWVAQGKTNIETGMILSMSSRTVQTHLDHIYRKLDVHSRAAAVAKAMEPANMA